MRLQGKTAIVTGGGRGIGAEYCKALANVGAAVLVADLDGDGAKHVANEIVEAGGRAHAFRLDVSSPQDTKAMADAAQEKFGGIDILVNNAAMYANLTRKRYDEITPDEFDQVMAVNVKGVWLCTMAVVPAMIQRGGGHIINIGSGSVFVGGNGLVHYVASKMGVMGLSRALARELGQYNICVNTLIPGLTDSSSNRANTTPEYLASEAKQRSIQRVQTPQDLIGPLLFLASDDSHFVSGQNLNCDGGRLFI
ncbi:MULTISPECIES: SDR family oxidoreductase [unclassified Beijerinckia]|uniref:SDR family NAD(P)-dependent oxidoreductase n=1 Tax=unclassified Beijerinckia TaxID=2638183 RepID=UPI00089A337C|nr:MULTISPECIES: SDR family oxidoreductase [unclassified Beijerinckia]MDH7796238.1 3-oxoacyl-[acyl-carrier protein] reductase [Beijerinckia sp. GAS462]SEC36404.1 3-oxoacyl-[acyl-carrier protein] reductase [Beijerinckia sp. 28-YEA-48]